MPLPPTYASRSPRRSWRRTHGAVADALAHILGLVLAADGAGHGTGADDNGLAQILALAAHELLHGAAEIAGSDGVTDTLTAELLALFGPWEPPAPDRSCRPPWTGRDSFSMSWVTAIWPPSMPFSRISTLRRLRPAVQTGSQPRRGLRQDDYIINLVVHSNGSC